MKRHRSISVRVPGSIGNVGPGLDILGLAIDGAWDTVTAAWSDTPGITIIDPGHPDLPTDPARNTAAIAAAAVFEANGIDDGISISIEKGLPLSGGMGGSAASAIGGAVAAALLARLNPTEEQLLAAALIAESTVAGRHLDNLAPSLLGGLVLCRSTDPVSVLRLDAPQDLRITLVTPDQKLLTRDSRRVLPEMVTREVALRQAASVAGMIAGALTDSVKLFAESLVDHIGEPVRAPLIPGFAEAKAAALNADAMACSISGAGPTAFALSEHPAVATEIGEAMVEAYRQLGIAARMRVTRVDFDGARLV